MWRSASEFNVLVHLLVNHRREAGFSLLASVEAIPAVVHVRVQLVVVASVVVLSAHCRVGVGLDPNRLD